VYLDGMIWEATAIHTAYPEFLNNQLRSQVFQEGKNPLLADMFNRVDSYDKRQSILDSTDRCIVLATSGMVTGGPVMEYLKSWGPNAKNSMAFVGFQAEGTLGRRIQRGAREIPVREGPGEQKTVRLDLEVAVVEGFSGHSDRRQLMNFVANMDPRPERIMLGHGEESKCIDLASGLHRKFNIQTQALMNLETVRFR
jgi:predicted metal-dependent RNase